MYHLLLLFVVVVRSSNWCTSDCADAEASCEFSYPDPEETCTQCIAIYVDCMWDCSGVDLPQLRDDCENACPNMERWICDGDLDYVSSDTGGGKSIVTPITTIFVVLTCVGIAAALFWKRYAARKWRKKRTKKSKKVKSKAIEMGPVQTPIYPPVNPPQVTEHSGYPPQVTEHSGYPPPNSSEQYPPIPGSTQPFPFPPPVAPGYQPSAPPVAPVYQPFVPPVAPVYQPTPVFEAPPPYAPC